MSPTSESLRLGNRAFGKVTETLKSDTLSVGLRSKNYQKKNKKQKEADWLALARALRPPDQQLSEVKALCHTRYG